MALFMVTRDRAQKDLLDRKELSYFFVRVADSLDLTTVEKDALVRSWAFGIEKRSWSLTSA